MENLVSVVSNTRPAFIAQPHFDEEDNIFEVDLEPIVAWKIIYNSNIEDENSIVMPITSEMGFPEGYAIYYADTKRWSFPTERSGHGLDKLLQHFREIHSKDQSQKISA